MTCVEQSKTGTLFFNVALNVCKSSVLYCLIKALLYANHDILSEDSDMLFPNSTCLPVSLQIDG